MFRQIELRSFQVEVILVDYLLKAVMQPRGPLVTFMNDRNWTYVPMTECELGPLAADNRVGIVKQTTLSVNKARLEILGLVNEDDTREVQLPTSRRPVIFYFGRVVVQGQLHVSSDAPDEDLLDEMHDFFPVSQATVYPHRPAAITPTRQVPLLLVNRLLIQSYHVQKRNRPEPVN